jgi:hypothetical protein
LIVGLPFWLQLVLAGMADRCRRRRVFQVEIG